MLLLSAFESTLPFAPAGQLINMYIHMPATALRLTPSLEGLLIR